MLTDVTTGIAELGSICKDLSLHEQADALTHVKERLQNHIFSVGIMGEFRRGKSTVINALLGQEIVPADIVPCSATLNYVRWGAEKHAEIYYKNGRSESVGVEELSAYITKITEASAKKAATVDYSVVHYPCQFCQNGVQIVDTPGLNDDDRMDAISQNVLPTLDAIIMVLVVDSPFSKSEAEFVRNKVMSSDLGRIIFVVNKIDTIDEDDRDRLLADIRKRIQNSVLEKMEAVYGKDSEDYINVRSKLGEIKLLPISARNALKGKIKNNRRQYEESGYPEFEAVLCKLLTEERGMLELISPVNKIGSTSKEALQAIDMRLTSLKMERAEFEKVQKQAISTIQENRKKKKEEIKALKAKGKMLYADLLPEMEDSYTQMEDDIFQYISDIHIADDVAASEDALKNFSEQISPEIDQQIKDVLSIQTERIMNRINDRIGRDIKELEDFGEDFASDMVSIQTNISLHTQSTSTGKKSNAGVAAAIDAATMLISATAFETAIPGVGGIIAGWREHGVKGAVVGGLGGAGLAYSAMQGAIALGLVGLPLVVIGGIAAAFGGRAIANLFFGRRETPQATSVDPDVIRKQLQSSARDAIDSMRDKKLLEKWLKETCAAAYEGVADNIDQEWENTLGTMESNLAQIKADLKKNAEDKQRVENELNSLVKKIQDIVTALKPVHEKLIGADHSADDNKGDVAYV